MADSKLSDLTSVTTPADTAFVYVADGGASKKISLNDLTAYLLARSGVHNASTAAQTPAAATDTYVNNSSVPITVSRLKAGTKYRCFMSITKTPAGTGTPTVNLRHGTAASTADTSRCLFTWPAANTAVADEMMLSITATFRSVGSGTSAVLEGMMLAEHELTTTGFGGTGLGSNIIVNTTSSGFDSTTASTFLGISINAGTAGAWTIRQVHTVLENFA